MSADFNLSCVLFDLDGTLMDTAPDLISCLNKSLRSHDIIAGRNAQMKTLAALYGYLNPGDKPEGWGADALIESPGQFATWITSALCH